MMAMVCGYVYVAQVAMGANQNQLIRALNEAEAWDGPSLVIAYSPCINHGIRGGMTISQRQKKPPSNAATGIFTVIIRRSSSRGRTRLCWIPKSRPAISRLSCAAKSAIRRCHKNMMRNGLTPFIRKLGKTPASALPILPTVGQRLIRFEN